MTNKDLSLSLSHTHTYSMNQQAHRFTGYGVKLQSSRTAEFQRDVLHIWLKVFSAYVLTSCIEVGHVCLKPLYTGQFWAAQNKRDQWWSKIAQWDTATDRRFRALTTKES